LQGVWVRLQRRSTKGTKLRAGFLPIRATREGAFSDFAEVVLFIVQAASALAALVVSVAYPGA